MVQIKKLAFIVILLVISLNLIYASAETDWLIQEYNKRDRTVEESALALLAVNKQLGSSASLSSAAAKLKSYLDSCTAANNCNNKDAALAVWALKEIKDTSTTLDTATNWLINSRTILAPDTDADDWLIQIISPTSGNCVVNNTEAKTEKTISISAGYTPWQSVKDLVTQNTNNLIIDCTSLSSQVDSISLIKKKTISNIVNYFIREEIQNQKSVTVQLGVPCWGSAYRSICNQEITAYVLLALYKQGKNPDPAWLGQQSLAPLENAVLYELTEKQEYLSALQSSQSAAGFWSPADVASTSLIYSFIPSQSETAKKALAWIQSQRASEGCWPKPSNLCNIKSTASAAYVTSQAANATTPPPGNVTRPSERTELEDCDEPCLDNAGCICPTNCKRSLIDEDETCEGPETTIPTTEPGAYCVTERLCDGQLDRLGRCVDIPGDDCPEAEGGEEIGPEGGIGTGETETTPSETKADEGKSSTLFWLLMVIAALIALVGGSYLAYKKGLIKFKKKPSPEYKPRMKIPEEMKTPQQYQPRIKAREKQHPVKKFLDNELDKSIEELEKLLKN